MSISSNSLFHYTNSLNTLKGILKNGFQPSYCLEESGAVPMISFCDLPLSQAKDQLNNYGNFAIGMTVEWGIKNGLNPVLYLESNSYLSKHYLTALGAAVKLAENIMKQPKGNDFLDLKDLKSSLIGLLDIDRFSKPYRGNLTRKDTIIQENYKFYNEREWRYIPNMNVKGIKHGLSHDEYEIYKQKNKKPHLKKHALTFTANDIKYLIVSSNADIPKIISFLESLENLGSSKKIQLLTTRIMTSEQIKEDI